MLVAEAGGTSEAVAPRTEALRKSLTGLRAGAL